MGAATDDARTRALRAERSRSSHGRRKRMPVERTTGGTSLIDVLDRVLDKGIVIDAWVRVSLVGIDLITVEARIVVASIETYLKYSEAVAQSTPALRSNAVETRSQEALAAENRSLRSKLAAA